MFVNNLLDQILSYLNNRVVKDREMHGLIVIGQSHPGIVSGMSAKDVHNVYDVWKDAVLPQSATSIAIFRPANQEPEGGVHHF